MGVKCIRTEKPLSEDEPKFLYQNMIMKKKDINPELEYEFLERIGRGSYSQVYRIRHRHTSNKRPIQTTYEP